MIFFRFFSIQPSSSNLIFCLFAETLSQTLTWRHAGTPTLSLSLSLSHTHTHAHTHTFSPSSKSDLDHLYVSFSLVCLEKSQGSERLCRIQARTTALLNEQQAQLTDDRRIDMHGKSQRLRLIREKFSQANKLRKYKPFSKKEVYFWDS